MANSGRNFGWLFLVAVLSGIVVFVGCGGSGGDDPIVGLGLSSGQIAGSLSRSGSLAAVKSSIQESILADVNFSQSSVYLEERPTLRAIPSASGSFLIGNVPFGNYHLVASMTSTGGFVYKVRSSGVVSVAQSAPTANTSLSVSSADKSDRQVQIELKDASGNPVAAAQVVVWGEAFTNLGNGLFLSPPMPANAVAQVTVTPSGGTLQTTVISGVSFTATATPTISTTLPPVGSTNHPPVIASLRATPVSSVSVNGTLSLVASATDPDGDRLIATWSVSAGTLSSVSTYSATWNAPATAATATVIFTLTEADRTPAYSATATTVVYAFSSGVATTTGLAVSVVSTGTNQIVSGNTLVNFAANPASYLGYSWAVSNGVILAGGPSASMTWQAPNIGAGISTLTTIVCTVSDGAQTGSAAVTLTVTGGPIASITQPVISTFYPGIKTFSGWGRDAFGSSLFGSSLSWYVSTGTSAPFLFGQGSSVNHTFTARGSYTVQLAATDGPGAVGTATINISIVNSPPSGVIASPTAGYVYLFGSPISLVGSGIDLEDGAITATNQLGWYSNRQGFIGSGSPLLFTPGLAGTHTIILAVVDGDGGYGTATSSLYVNQPPLMTFTPASDATFFTSFPVSFSGSGTDPDTGLPISSATMNWDIPGVTSLFGTATFQLAQPTPLGPNTSPGHFVSLNGADSNGLTATVTKRIYTGVSAAAIATPTIDGPGPRYNTGSSLAFVGTPSDAERRSIAVAWILDRGLLSQAILGTTGNLTTSAIASGWRTLTYVGTDSAGIVSSSTVAFWVNRLPMATMTISTSQYATGPANTPIFLVAPVATVNMSVTATDFEAGGAVSPASITWSVDGGLSFIASGSTLNYNFPPGNATVVVRAWDNHGFYGEVSKSFWVWEAEQYTLLVNGPLGITSSADDALFVTSPTTSEIFKLVRDTALAEATQGDLTLALASGAASLSATLTDLTFGNSSVLSLETNKSIQGFSAGDLASNGPVLWIASFSNPTALAFGQGSHWVADSGVGRLFRINPLNGNDQGGVSLTDARGVAFHASNNVYVTLGSSNELRKYDVGFNRDTGFSGAGATNARRVALGSNFIFVSDGQNPGGIHLFNYSGTKLTTFGGPSGLGSFNAPMGMVVVNNVDLYIVETGADRITRIRHGAW